MRWIGNRDLRYLHHKLLAGCLLLVILGLPAAGVAQEKTPLFIDEVRFKGTPSSMEKQVPLWGSALAAEVSGTLRDLETYTPMTLQTLESQLGKERRKAALECADASCINRLVENFGIAESVFGVVTWLGPKKVQVTLVHAAGDEKVGEAAPRYATPEYDAIAQALRTMAGELFGLRGRVLEQIVGRDRGALDTSGLGEVGGGEDVGTYTPPSGEDVVVRVESTPPGAKVKLRGITLCPSTPCPAVEVPGGQQVFEFQKDRYRPETVAVEIRRGMKPVKAALTALFGWLTVSSEPAGIPVTLDGGAVGVTPLQKLEVDPGRHRVEVGDERYAVQWKEFDLGENESKEYTFQLQARQGGLKVKARNEKDEPVEGKVFVDGQEVGVTGRAFEAIVGPHKVEVRSTQGMGTASVIVREGETLEVQAFLST